MLLFQILNGALQAERVVIAGEALHKNFTKADGPCFATNFDPKSRIFNVSHFVCYFFLISYLFDSKIKIKAGVEKQTKNRDPKPPLNRSRFDSC